MVENYESYKSGDLTKGQYDYRRRKLVTQLSQKLGPTQWLLNGTSDLSEVLRISQRARTEPVAPLKQQALKLVRSAKLASAGGIALTAVSLGMACRQIAEAESTEEKNGILVEAVIATGVSLGLGSGAALAVFLIWGPLGWVASLVVAAGAAAAGILAGKSARNFYEIKGQGVDLVGPSGIGTLCSQPETKREPKIVAPGLSMRI